VPATLDPGEEVEDGAVPRLGLVPVGEVARRSETTSVEPRIFCRMTFMGASDGSRSPPTRSTGIRSVESWSVMWSIASNARSEFA